MSRWQVRVLHGPLITRVACCDWRVLSDRTELIPSEKLRVNRAYGRCRYPGKKP